MVGLSVLLVGSLLFSIKRKIILLILLDIVSLVAPVGIFFGRISNFINSELFGKPTDAPWSVIFPNIDEQPRHPSQIYEAILEGAILFFILNLIIKKLDYIKGKMCSCFFNFIFNIQNYLQNNFVSLIFKLVIFLIF